MKGSIGDNAEVNVFWMVAAKIGGTVAGIAAIYAGAWLYEDQEGRLQDKLEEWWIRVDDAELAWTARVAAIARAAANITRHALDRVFGGQIWSTRAAATTGLLSLSSLCLVLYLLRHIIAGLAQEPAPNFENIADPIDAMSAYVGVVLLVLFGLMVNLLTFPGFDSSLLIVGAAALVLAIAPAWLHWLRRTTDTVFAILLLSLAAAIAIPEGSRPRVLVAWLGVPDVVGGALILGIGMDIVFVAGVRWLITRQTNARSFAAGLAFACAPLCVLMLLVGAPVALGYVLLDAKMTYPAFASLFSVFTNLYAVGVCLSFFVATLFLLLHIVVWRLAARPLYFLQRSRIFQNTASRAFLIAIGFGLLGATWSPIDDALRAVRALLN